MPPPEYLEGVSFNNRIVKGPDLMAALSTITTSSRQKQIAFYITKISLISPQKAPSVAHSPIRPTDTEVIFRKHLNKDLQVFEMDVFSTTYSPCIAQYFNNKNAKQQFPEAPTFCVKLVQISRTNWATQ